MAQVPLTDHFRSFFKRLNPRPSFVERASSEHRSVTSLIEDGEGRAAVLSPCCFLQGSFKQETAIYTINDVDIIVLCRLWHPAPEGGSGVSWSRDKIFDTIAAPLLADQRYRDKVRYHPGSMCIKVDLGIKLEILPVVYKSGNHDPAAEPFRLYRPELGQWEDGYARRHQDWLTWKNKRADNHFIPCIKVFKHLRSRFGLDAVSFHLECLLFHLPEEVYTDGPADYIAATLASIARTTADAWYRTCVPTPCGERNIFTANEWPLDWWRRFHKAVATWAQCADHANRCQDPDEAVQTWQLLFGEDFFPKEVVR